MSGLHFKSLDEMNESYKKLPDNPEQLKHHVSILLSQQGSLMDEIETIKQKASLCTCGAMIQFGGSHRNLFKAILLFLVIKFIQFILSLLGLSLIFLSWSPIVIEKIETYPDCFSYFKELPQPLLMLITVISFCLVFFSWKPDSGLNLLERLAYSWLDPRSWIDAWKNRGEKAPN